jgi:pimeloyl-ACP methyl ester carboxylesterase
MSRIGAIAATAIIALAALLTSCPLAIGATEAPPATGLQNDVVFTAMTPLSRNSELARRLWSPVEAARLQRQLARSGKSLREQPINLSGEHFTVYVPPGKPQNGYGLLVYISPGKEVRLPPGWAPVLDQYGVIFVSADEAGNEADVYGRRIPLALNAASGILQRYPVDPLRVYVSGTSGGSRVAMRVALAYPDLFHGAMLNAGSDEIDNDYIPLPPRELLFQFQAASRLVYITGDEDTVNLNKDAASRGAMRAWCQFNIDTEIMRRTGHGVADAGALARVLKLLLAPPEPDADKLNACRSDIQKQLDAQIAQAEGLKAAGKDDEAKSLLDKLDRRFGGLGAPRTVQLDTALEGPAGP